MTEPGLYPDVPEADYHRDPNSLSVSGAKLILKAPALFQWEQKHPATKAVWDYGSAAHALILGRGIEQIYVAPFDNWQTKAAQTERKIAHEEGLSPVLPADWDQVCAMAEELEGHSLARELLTGGQPEVSAYGIDEPTGVMRRARFDYLRDDLIVDYKTARSADPEAFGRAAASYGYHQQHAWYLDLARDLGRAVKGFVFIVQMSEPPYLVSVCELVSDAVEMGRYLNRAAIERYRDCTDSGIWPGFPTYITPVDIPRYAYSQEPS